MRDKDQILLEAAYEKMLAGSNNPGWNPEQALTSGKAFEPWKPKGGWPKEKTSSKGSVPKHSPKKKKEDEDINDFGFENGEEIGSFRSTDMSSSPAEEPQSPQQETQDLTISFDLLDSIKSRDEELYTIISSLAHNVEREGDNLKFSYSPEYANNIKNFIQAFKQRS